MRKSIIILFFLAECISALCQTNGKSPYKPNPADPFNQLYTPEVMLRYKRISEPKISPDGRWVLYTAGMPNMGQNKINKEIFMLDINGKTGKLFVSDTTQSYNGMWYPDQSRIAFVSTRVGSVPQIFTMDISLRDIRQITFVPNGVDNVVMSPDGSKFAFTSDVKVSKNLLDKYPDFPKTKARIYDKLPVRHWDQWEDENYSHLFIVGSNGGNPKDLMFNEPYDTPVPPFGGAEQIAWSPDSKEIAYTCKKLENQMFTTNSDIYVVPVEGGQAKNITEKLKGADFAPLYSPDGKYIAFHSQEREGFESDRIRLMLYDREKERISELSKTLDQWVNETIWAQDSKSLYFTAENGATVQIYQIRTDDGSWKILSKGWCDWGHGLDLTPDGRTLIVGRMDFNHPVELYNFPLDSGEPKKITILNDEIYRAIKPVIVKERWFIASDGKKFQSWIIYPPDFDSTLKYPMITYLQGGPQSTVSQFFSYRWNLCAMASHGYIILAANRRGVPGFGQAWCDAISKDWGGMPMKDYLTATDEMCKEKYIDKDGLCAIGASAGGYAAFWLEGVHNHRFKAFVAHCGVFNMESMYGSTEELWFPNWENGGPYWDSTVKTFYDKNSPHRFVQNWDTPIMISTGEKDFRVPFTQSLEAFTAAQSKGIPSKLIVFPNENHWIMHLQEQAVWYRELFEFLDKYCMKNKL